MCHYYNDTVLHVSDTSNNGRYHNKRFKETAESHGLICHTSRYFGYSDTSSEISDRLIEWVLENNVRDIELSRNDPNLTLPVNKVGKAADKPQKGEGKKSTSIRYHCPKCGAIVRATRKVNIMCGDCDLDFIEG